MGLFTLFSTWYQRSVDESQDPGSLVIRGDIEILKRRLNHGLSPNFEALRGNLLWLAIICENTQIAALLIFYGADPNKSCIRDHQQHTVAETILGWQYYCESLVKFMMTYNAHFDHEKKFSDQNECIAAALKYAPRRYELYDFIQEGECALEDKHYLKAKVAFEKAIPLFEEFIQEEEDKWKQQLAGVSVAVGYAKHAKETHPDIIEYYKIRRTEYLAKIAECDCQLNPQTAMQATDSAEEDVDEHSSFLINITKKMQ